MLQIALNLSKLSLALFIEACRSIISSMTGNANFTTPNPSLASITTAIDDLEDAYTDWLNGNKRAHDQLRSLRRTVAQLMNQLKSYVQTTSGQNIEVALSSGMALKRTPQPHNSIDPVQNVRAFPLSANGQVRVRWNATRHAKGYLMYKTPNLADPMDQSHWSLIGSVTRRNNIVSDLTSATRIAFIVLAVGPRNIVSQPSEPAIAMVA